jgi:4-hydroxy-3-methylbut-2-enyl diphosphate reductase
MIQVTIDPNSGYCFGVEYAIQMAESALDQGEQLFCLGDIVHNDMELERLKNKGLQIINHQQLAAIRDAKVLIRAHGEPPSTYQMALQNNLELIDASCPVVLKLQNRIKNAFDQSRDDKAQLVIYGKKGHAEVIGLSGQTNHKAIVISQESEIDQINLDKPVILFSQTTKSTKGFYQLKESISQKIQQHAQTKKAENEAMPYFEAFDSICRQVSNREPQLKKFAQEQHLILFVSGKNSSNGKSLFEVCKQQNANSFFIEKPEDIDPVWLTADSTVGICGATSTPNWLMEAVKLRVETLDSQLHQLANH